MKMDKYWNYYVLLFSPKIFRISMHNANKIRWKKKCLLDKEVFIELVYMDFFPRGNYCAESNDKWTVHTYLKLV